MAEKYRHMIYRPALSIYKMNGEKLGGPFSIKGVDRTTIPTPISRPKLISFLYNYVISLGISITFVKRVIKYYEILETGTAGAVTEEGERFEADLVIAADGVGSKSWSMVSSSNVKPKSSGFSSYRVAYPTNLAFENPLLAKELALEEGGDDICRVYLGTNKHAIILTSPETTTWIYQHRVGLSALAQIVEQYADACRTTVPQLSPGRVF
jgi:2-polyprenyl-6-methoxyphenol hydroxylase-like FAD-dependent oxidoreductase